MIIMAYEDFTSVEWIETDPEGELTVTANKIQVLDQDIDGKSRVNKDYGVDYFDGDFEHTFEFTLTGGTQSYYALMVIWALSNSNSKFNDFADNDVAMWIMGDAGVNYAIRLAERDYVPTDITVDLIVGTKYYITIARSGSVYTATIRTGSHSGTVVDTILIDSGSAKSFRYLHMQNERGG